MGSAPLSLQAQSGEGNKAFLEERCEDLPRGMEGWHMKQAWSEEGVMHVQPCGSGEGTILAQEKSSSPTAVSTDSALRWQLRAPTLLG